MLTFIIALLLVLFLLLYFSVRFYFLFFHNHHQNTKIKKQLQFSKLKKRIILQDGYELNYQLKNYVKSKYFFICFHGLNESLKDFQWFSKFANRNRFSYLLFDQRNFAENEKNSSFDLKRNFEDCIEVIKLIKQTYPNKKIILLGHSLGSTISAYLSTNNYVKKHVFGIILTAIVYQKYIYNPFIFLRLSFKNIINLLIGILCNSSIVISLREHRHNSISGLSKTHQENLFKKLQNQSIPLYFFAQAAWYNKQIISNLSDHQASKLKFLIIKHEKDLATNLVEFSKKIPKLKIRHLTVKTASNAGHLINTSKKTSQTISQLILEWISEFRHKNSASKPTQLHKSTAHTKNQPTTKR